MLPTSTNLCLAFLLLLSLLCSQREISQTQQLPAIILAPTNAALGDYLLALRTLKAQADSSGANGGGSTAQDVAGDSGPPPQPSVQQLVDDVLQDTATSLVLLRRHCEHSRLRPSMAHQETVTKQPD